MSRQTVNSTCRGLRSWYQQMEKPYPDDGRRGLFTQWFEDGEFEESDMQGEFDEKDCAYLDFSYNDDTGVNEFPFPGALRQSDDTKKQLFQLRMMRHCWNHGTPKLESWNSEARIMELRSGIWADEKANEYNSDSTDYTEANEYNLDSIDYSNTEASEYNLDDISYAALITSDTEWPPAEQTAKLYEAHCTKLNEKMRSQPEMLTLAAIGHQHKIPLLTYFTDCFQRARLSQQIAVGFDAGTNILTPLQWTSSNAYLQQVAKDQGSGLPKKFANCIETYGKRVAPLFQFDAFRPVIDDDLFQIVKYLNAAVMFMQKLLRDGSTLSTPTCPMQFDFSIAVRECTIPKPKTLQVPSDGDQDDEIDDEDDDADEKSEYDDADESEYEYLDVLQDVDDRLKRSGTRFFKDKVEFGDDHMKGYFGIIKDLYSSLYVQQVAQLHNDLEFPRGRRLCCLVDRRNKMTRWPKNDWFVQVARRPTSQEPDEFYFYLPPDDCDRVDTRHGIREAYFDRIQQCLIPNATYNEDKKAITSNSTCNGGLITFSFQVEAADEIACYLHWNGKCTRFLPEDVLVVLPELFAKTKENKEFMTLAKPTNKSERAKILRRALDGIKYHDKRFQSFYDKVKMTADKRFLCFYITTSRGKDQLTVLQELFDHELATSESLQSAASTKTTKTSMGCSSLQCYRLQRLIKLLYFHQQLLDLEHYDVLLAYVNDTDLLDDWNHVLFEHFGEKQTSAESQKQFELIYEQLMLFKSFKECKMKTCSACKRNQRDTESDIKQRAYSFTINILDEIHCYLLHSYDRRFRQRATDIQDPTEEKSVDDAVQEAVVALLKSCGLEQFATRFQGEGLSDANLWTRDHLSDEKLKNMGMTAEDVDKFRKFCEKRVEQQGI